MSMSGERQREILLDRPVLRFPDDVPVMVEHLKRGWTVGGGDAVLILEGLLVVNEKLDRLLRGSE